MIKPIVYFTTLIFCCSCSTNFVDNRAFIKQRSPIIQSLEETQRYAEALTQWKILQLTYPNDDIVKENIKRLELFISDRIIKQLDVLDNTKNVGNKTRQRKVYLKILALDPMNEIAIQELRKFEWQDTISEASSKTANIKKYFVESQKEASLEIKLTKYLEQGEQFTHDKKYKGLLQLADKFEESYPTHPQPHEYRILAYTKLGDSQHQQNNPQEAIEYYRQALRVAALKNIKLAHIESKKDTLSELLANKYFTLANEVFKTDLDAAIEYFKLSLKYQPNNIKARQLQKQAVKMRHNLIKIKKLNANSD